MLFSRKSKNIKELAGDLDAIKEDLSVFKKNIESDLENIKKDFREMILFLQENQGIEEGSPGEEEVNQELGENEVENIKKDIMTLKKSVTDILNWTYTINKEIDTVKERIDDARKDIKNRITYAVARLKT